MAKYNPITPAELNLVLNRLAELARADNIELRLRITGGALMMVAFNARTTGTRDLDVLKADPRNIWRSTARSSPKSAVGQRTG